MRYKLKSLDPMGVGKVTGAIYGGMSLLIVPFVALAMVVGAFAKSKEAGIAIVLALGLILVLPVVYGLMGFVMGALMAVVYNFVSRWIGGIVMELVPADTASVEPFPEPPYPLVPGGADV